MFCAAVSTLSPYVPSADVPWDAARVRHLYRRLSFGASPAEVNRALNEGPDATVRRLLAEAVSQPRRAAPEWAEWNYDDFMAAGREQFQAYVDWNFGYMERALTYGVREKLLLFWMNHFVAKFESYGCPRFYRYWMEILTEHAFGHFPSMVEEVTKTPAMLFFLNGFQNNRFSPNENYARELFELFTLGEDNGYTQEDIVQASRALTGYNGWTQYCGPVNFVDWGFDDGDKTVFGQTGNFRVPDLVRVIFEERGVEAAGFICEKLYRYYVNEDVDAAVVDAMAATLRANNFTILPVLEELFLSEHFFDAAHVGARIKSPLDMLIGFLKDGGFETFPEWTVWGFWSSYNAGQYLGEPPDVSGWPGGRSWIDSNRLTLRWESMDGFTWGVHNQNEQTYPGFARALVGNSSSPEIIARAIVDYFLPGGLAEAEGYELATDVLKWDVPANYYVDGTWSLDYPTVSWQITLLLRHIARLPEFQLA